MVLNLLCKVYFQWEYIYSKLASAGSESATLWLQVIYARHAAILTIEIAKRKYLVHILPSNGMEMEIL